MQTPVSRAVLPATAGPSEDWGLSVAEAKTACGLFDDLHDHEVEPLIQAARERVAKLLGSAWPVSNAATYYYRGLTGGLLAPGAAVGVRTTAPSVALRYWAEGSPAAAVIPDATYRALVRGPDIQVHPLTRAAFAAFAVDPGMAEPVELSITLATESGVGETTESVRAAMRAMVAGLYNGLDPHEFQPIVRSLLPRRFWA